MDHVTPGTEALAEALNELQAMPYVVAGAAHDMLNALQIVIGEAELLCAQASSAEQAQTILTATRHAAGMCRELLQITRPHEVPAGALDPRPVLETCHALVARIANKANLRCTFELDPELAAVGVAPLQLQAAVINLCVNARDATPQGGEIRLRARNLPPGARLPETLAPGAYVCVEVEDTGAGMTPEVVGRATEAFFTTKPAGRGTGLGLAMVHAFTARAGGLLQMDSQPGRGTRVQLLLPVARVETGSAAESQPALAALQGRVRAAILKSALSAVDELYRDGALPRPARLEAALAPYRARLLVLAVDCAQPGAQPVLRLLQIGDSLLHLLERLDPVDAGRQRLDLVTEVEQAYRRALGSRRPIYEHAGFRFGPGDELHAERLIFPASLDGETVSHLFGLVMMPEQIIEGE